MVVNGCSFKNPSKWQVCSCSGSVYHFDHCVGTALHLLPYSTFIVPVELSNSVSLNPILIILPGSVILHPAKTEIARAFFSFFF